MLTVVSKVKDLSRLVAFTYTAEVVVSRKHWKIATLFYYSLTHFCAWPAEGRSDLHIDRSMDGCDPSYAHRLSQVLLHMLEPRSTWSARWARLQPGAERIPLEASMQSWESIDVAEQVTTTVGYYELQILETSLPTDCSVLDVWNHLMPIIRRCGDMKSLDVLAVHLSYSPCFRPVQENRQEEWGIET